SGPLASGGAKRAVPPSVLIEPPTLPSPTRGEGTNTPSPLVGEVRGGGWGRAGPRGGPGPLATPLASRPFDAQERRFSLWSERAADRPALAGFNRLAALCRAEGLGPVIDLAEVWAGAGRWLTAAVERQGFEAVLARSFAERPALAGFDVPGHEQAVSAFV